MGLNLKKASVCAAGLIWTLLCLVGYAAEQESYELAFSTYVGGERWEHARDVIVFHTQSEDMPTTEGALSREHLGGEDGYVAMLEDDGSGLVYGTYVGGSGQDWGVSTHNLALDAEGNGDCIVARFGRTTAAK